MQSEQFTTIVIKADEGKFLTQVADIDIRERIVASVVAIGKNDSASNWQEINATQAKHYRDAQEEARNDDEEAERKRHETVEDADATEVKE